MFSISEQLTAASKAVFEAQLASANAFNKAAFDSGKTWIDLHVGAFKATLAAGTDARNQFLSVKDPQEWMALTKDQSQQALERARDFGRQAGELAQATKTRFTEVAETEIANHKEKVGELVEAVKQAPADSVAPLNTFFKGAFDKAQEGYDQLAKAGQKAGADFKEASDKAVRSVTPPPAVVS